MNSLLGFKLDKRLSTVPMYSGHARDHEAPWQLSALEKRDDAT